MQEGEKELDDDILNVYLIKFCIIYILFELFSQPKRILNHKI